MVCDNYRGLDTAPTLTPDKPTNRFVTREKVMRGLERKDSPILTGYQLFHNYIRPHKALDYKTPAELAGIEIRGRDKWLTIIQNASKR